MRRIQPYAWGTKELILELTSRLQPPQGIGIPSIAERSMD
jgi:hypothetical protein